MSVLPDIRELPDISGYGFRRDFTGRHPAAVRPDEGVRGFWSPCAARAARHTARTAPRRARHRTASARPSRARASRAAFAGRSIALSRPPPSCLRKPTKNPLDPYVVATQQVRDPEFSAPRVAHAAARMAHGLARVAELRREAAAWLLGTGESEC